MSDCWCLSSGSDGAARGRWRTVAAIATALTPRVFAHGHFAALDMTTTFFVAAILAILRPSWALASLRLGGHRLGPGHVDAASRILAARAGGRVADGSNRNNAG